MNVLRVVFTRAADVRLKKRGVNLARVDQSPCLSIEGSDPVLARCEKEKLVTSGEGRISQRLGIELAFC
jgi:hypothetical protein